MLIINSLQNFSLQPSLLLFAVIITFAKKNRLIYRTLRFFAITTFFAKHAKSAKCKKIKISNFIKSQINVIHLRLSQEIQACASPFLFKGRAGDGYLMLARINKK